MFSHLTGSSLAGAPTRLMLATGHKSLQRAHIHTPDSSFQLSWSQHGHVRGHTEGTHEPDRRIEVAMIYVDVWKGVVFILFGVLVLLAIALMGIAGFSGQRMHFPRPDIKTIKELVKRRDPSKTSRVFW